MDSRNNIERYGETNEIDKDIYYEWGKGRACDDKILNVITTNC